MRISKIYKYIEKVEIIELHNIIPELKNSVVEGARGWGGVQYRLDQMEQKIDEPEDRAVELIEPEQTQWIKSEDSLRDLWDTIRWTHIHIIEVSEGGERERRERKNIKKNNGYKLS